MDATKINPMAFNVLSVISGAHHMLAGRDWVG